jgi:hypothetical protein
VLEAASAVLHEVNRIDALFERSIIHHRPSAFRECHVCSPMPIEHNICCSAILLTAYDSGNCIPNSLCCSV